MKAPKENIIIISDVDDVLVDSLRAHHAAAERQAQDRGWEVPGIKLFCQAGGTVILENLPGFLEYHQQNLLSPEFNTSLEPLADALSARDFLAATLALYLTARPNSLNEVTRKHLIGLGFPDRPVIGRPDSVSMENTAPWKYAELAAIAEGLNRHNGPDRQGLTRIIFVDDSYKTVQFVNDKGHPLINAYTYEGLGTPQHGERGVYPINWQQIMMRYKGQLKAVITGHYPSVMYHLTPFQSNGHHNRPSQAR